MLAPPRSKGPLIAGGIVAVLAVAGAGLWLWQPWKAPWQKSVPDFLAGSWCRPMSGDALARFDFVRAGTAEVRGEIHFSHSYDVIRSKATTESKADAFVLHWTEPENFVAGGPTTYKIVDEISFEALPEDPKEAEAADYQRAIWTRCARDSGN